VVLLAVVFGLLLVDAALRPRRWVLVALALTAWTGALTHYFFGFVVLAGGAWLWSARPRPVAAGRATAALAAGALACLPWLPSFAAQRAHGRYGWIGSFEVAEVARLPGALFFGPDGVFYGLARLAVTVAVVGGGVALCRRREANAVVVLALLPIAAAAAMWAAGEPIFNTRNMLPVAPFLAILAAAGLKALPARAASLGCLAAIAVTLGAAVYSQTALGRVQYDSVAHTLTRFGWSGGDTVVISYPTAGGERRGAGIQIASPLGWYLPGRPLLTWTRRRDCRTRFAIVQVSRPASWLARYGGRVAASRVFAYYDHPILGRPYGSVVVVRFRRPTRVAGAVFYVFGRKLDCAAAALAVRWVA
jgi:hypothetical protein